MEPGTLPPNCDFCNNKDGEAGDRVCQCTQGGQTLCGNCNEAHNTCMSRGHALTQPTICANEEQTPLRKELLLDESCPDHGGEVVRFHCNDHQTPCCSVCVVVKHRKCEDLVEINALGKEMRNSGFSQRLLKETNRALLDGKVLLESRTQLQSDLETTKSEITERINEMVKSLHKAVDDLSSSALEKLSSLHQEQRFDLEEDLALITSENEFLQNAVKVLEFALSSDSDIQLFLASRDTEKKYNSSKVSTTDRKSKNKSVTYNFRPSPWVRSFLDEATSLGDVTPNCKFSNLEGTVSYCPVDFRSEADTRKETELRFSKSDPVRKRLQFCKAKLFQTISGKLVDDKLDCNFTGLDVFNNGDIITVDNSNKQMKLFSSEGDILNSHSYELPHPHSVVVLHDRVAAVTVTGNFSEYRPEVNIFSVTAENIAKLRTVPAPDNVYDAVRVDMNCVALCGTASSTCLLHVQEDGQTRKVQVKGILGTATNLFGLGYHAQKELHLTNRRNDLIGFHLRQGVKFRYTFQEREQLRGITTDGDDNIYVCVKNAMKVSQISSEGQLVQDVPTSPLKPSAVAICKVNNRLIVCGAGNIIHVYNSV